MATKNEFDRPEQPATHETLVLRQRDGTFYTDTVEDPAVTPTQSPADD